MAFHNVIARNLTPLRAAGTTSGTQSVHALSALTRKLFEFQTAEALQFERAVSASQRGRANASDDKLLKAIRTPSFQDGPQDQTRNLEIPGSMLRIAPE
jgi:hypothetical protein